MPYIALYAFMKYKGAIYIFLFLFVRFLLLQAHQHHGTSIYKVIIALNVRFQNHQTEISPKDCAVFHSGYLQAFE